MFGLSVYEALVSTWPANVPWTVPVGWLVLQGVMMLLVGYVTATLASVQREQRSALAEAYERQAAANERLQQYAATLEELTISRERNRLARGAARHPGPLAQRGDRAVGGGPLAVEHPPR